VNWLRFARQRRTRVSPPTYRCSCVSRPDLAVIAPIRQRMLNLDTDIARHLQIAAALLARFQLSWRFTRA
jgi:hypothetical protein